MVDPVWWCVDLRVGDTWCPIGNWEAEPPPDVGQARDALRYWLDHRPLQDARYRVRQDTPTPIVAELDYQRAGPMPGYQRADRDQGPYVCPHCGVTWKKDENRSEWIYCYCSACHRFSDGCARRGFDHIPWSFSSAPPAPGTP